METVLKLYQTLLKAYTEQVKGLEDRKKKAEAEVAHRLELVPHMVLNSRMFTYDEYLTNIYYGGFCYEEKNRVIPHLVNFLAAYEKSSDEEKAAFENMKPKNEFQQHLDELYVEKEILVSFFNFNLMNFARVRAITELLTHHSEEMQQGNLRNTEKIKESMMKKLRL